MSEQPILLNLAQVSRLEAVAIHTARNRAARGRYGKGVWNGRAMLYSVEAVEAARGKRFTIEQLSAVAGVKATDPNRISPKRVTLKRVRDALNKIASREVGRIRARLFALADAIEAELTKELAP